jgi:hypothetical protein
MADDETITIEALSALVAEAAEHLRRVEAASLRKLAEVSAEHVHSRRRIKEADVACLVEASCQFRALVREQHLLRTGSSLLADERAALQPDDHAGADEHREKVERHHARVLTHIEHLGDCLHALQSSDSRQNHA